MISYYMILLLPLKRGVELATRQHQAKGLFWTKIPYL